MKTIRILVFTFYAILLCLSSCGGGGDEPLEPTPKPEVSKSEIVMDLNIIANGLTFSSDNGDHSISFTCSEDWTLSVSNTASWTPWCVPSVTSGTKGTANVKFSVTENTSYESRSVIITIKSGTASKTFTILQKGSNTILVTSNKYEVSQEGGIINIEVKANIDYNMEISEKDQGWIKESSNRSLSTYKHTLNISANEEIENREGEIYFRSGNIVETVTVFQAGGSIIILSQKEYNVSDKGEIISVDINSNVDFNIQMPEVDWIIEHSSSKSLSKHRLEYLISANDEYDSRSAYIIFYDKNSEINDSLKVVQKQKDIIIVSENNFTLDQNGGIVEIEIVTNVNFKCEIEKSAQSWISEISSRGLASSLVKFKVEENESSEGRKGIITIIGEGIKKEVTIHQVVNQSESNINASIESWGKGE